MFNTELKPNYIIYDTTLRDGTQGAGVAFTTETKLRALKVLDELGVHYIEGGWPGSNAIDSHFFEKAQDMPLKNARLAAFGSTRRAAIHVADDPTLQFLLDAKTPVCTLVGKASLSQVTEVLRTTDEENLAMINESVAYLKECGKEVGFDAEHFFDGFKENPDYTLETLKVAIAGGVDWIALCDTNGGTSMNDMRRIIRTVVNYPQITVPLGIHTHNDRGLALPNTLIAVEEGVKQIQGTINGYGERTGNANLLTIIGNLQVSEGFLLIPESQQKDLTRISQLFEQLSGCAANLGDPYVGRYAFTHKAGLHADGVLKKHSSYEHVPPESVGNRRTFKISEQGGTATMEVRIAELGLPFPVSKNFARTVSEKVKELSSQGFQFDTGSASFEILVRRLHPDYKPPIDLEIKNEGKQPPKAFLKINNPLLETETGTASEGASIELTPKAEDITSMFQVMKDSLIPYYQSLNNVTLESFYTHVINDHKRVLVELSDGKKDWAAVYVNHNNIQAAWLALKDAMEYAILHPDQKG